MTSDKTIHIRKPKLVRATPQEDFGPAIEPKTNKVKDQDEAPPVMSTRRDLDEMSMLDFFAMVVSPGVAKRIEAPDLVAIESYKIAQAMVRMSKVYRPE